jgi:GNAT superfamily N-acetyltransferase
MRLLMDRAEAIRVRPAQAGDAQALAALCRAHAAFEEPPYQADGHTSRLAHALGNARLHAWVAERDGDIVGYASATLDFSTLCARTFVHLDCLYLDPQARNCARGSALMAAVAEFGRRKGYRDMQWQTPAWNEAALRFYDRSGARRLSKQRYTLPLAAVVGGASA